MNGSSQGDAARRRVRKLLFTVLWLAILGGLVVIYFFLGQRGGAQDAGGSLIGLVGLGPLLVSIVIRWLVLPRYMDAARALPLFIVGLATAEACGILGIFLGGPWRDHFFALGLLGVVQYAPFLLPKLFRAPAESFRSGT